MKFLAIGFGTQLSVNHEVLFMSFCNMLFCHCSLARPEAPVEEISFIVSSWYNTMTLHGDLDGAIFNPASKGPCRSFKDKKLPGGYTSKCLFVKISLSWGAEGKSNWNCTLVSERYIMVRFQADCIFLSCLISVEGEKGDLCLNCLFFSLSLSIQHLKFSPS